VSVRRWPGFAAFVAAAALVAGCGSSASTAPSTTVIERQPAVAMFPYYSSGVRYVTPSAAALDFATKVLGMSAPTVSAVSDSPAFVSVDVLPSGGSVPTVVVVSRVVGGDTWWVTRASSKWVTITQPTQLATVSSPITLAGTSTAFEAVVNVSVYADGSWSPIATGTVMGGSNGEVLPFHGSIAFPATGALRGTLVMYTKSAKDGSTEAAAAVRIRF
jgi:Immunoglobulin-like domain of bacterial spore germination